jgi:hypothetical protein
MKRIILVAFIFAVFAQPTPGAKGLYCPAPEVPEALKSSNAVFIGEVVEIIKPLTSDLRAPLPGHFYTIRFRVEKAWKAVNELEINVLVPVGGYETLPLPEKKGDMYLAYAYNAYTFEGIQTEWLLMGTMCNRTMPISRASDDIRGLEDIASSCSENDSKSQEVNGNRNEASSLKQSQDILRLPWYVITSNNLRPVEEIILGKRKVADACRLCPNLK